jgi:helix-turn-helix protein
MESQNKQIRAHLESGKSITALEALNRFGCLRLSGRIYDLSHNEGLSINSKMVTRHGKRVAEYSLQGQ